MKTPRDPARITVLGAGFGALSTVRDIGARRATFMSPEGDKQEMP